MADVFSALARLLPLNYETDELLDRRICIACRRSAHIEATRTSIDHEEECEVGAAEALLDELRQERNRLNARRVMQNG